MSIESPDFSYLCFGCQELANNARLSSYVQWAAQTGAWDGSDCCVEMPHACWCENDGSPNDFVDPITDEVCWYDPAAPESSEYLGMYITKVMGLRDSAFARGVTDNLGRGVTLGRGRQGSRVFVIEAMVIATSCCGMDYGMEYIRRVLERGCGQGSCLTGCGDLASCGLTCMTGRVCCPEDVEDFDSGLRQWVNVGIVDGVKEVEDGSSSCRCCMRKVTFTVQAETAQSYTITPVVCLDKNADLENTAVRCFDWINGCPDTVPTEDDCTDDPLCAPNACVLPAAPQRVNYCFCEPLGVSVDCCCATDAPSTRDETYRIIIDAGQNATDPVFSAAGLRNLRMLFYPGSVVKPCPSDDEDAVLLWSHDDACAILEIPYLKPGAQMVIDGRTDSITVQCDGKCYPGWNSAFGVNGTDPFPLLGSCAGLIMCVEWDLYATQFVQAPMVGAFASHIRVERFRVYA